jgi:small subunit ribosomal protein S7
MARRSKPENREIPPDVRYSNVNVQNFINRILSRGKKSIATTLVYDAFDLIEERVKRDPVEVFEQAIKNVAPMMEVKPRRVGGATYQVPMEVPPYRRFALASRWIVMAAKARSGKTFSEKLAGELMEAANGAGAAMRRRDEVHKMAEANRAYSHYRV